MKKNLLIVGGSGFIGTNYCALFSNKYNIRVIDIQPSCNAEYRFVDALDFDKLSAEIKSFTPNYIIDFAARTDVNNEISAKDGYSINWEIAKNILSICRKSKVRVESIVFTSTQYVIGPDSNSFEKYSYSPHTTYGESKVIMEKLVREVTDLHWNIVRPTNVWGPFHQRYANELYWLMKRGLFYVPRESLNVLKSYAYVGTVCKQIDAILNCQTHSEVFYVGDRPVKQFEWLDLQANICGGRIKIAPMWLFKVLAFIGDLLMKIGVKFPVKSQRLDNMLIEYLVPMDDTFRLVECESLDEACAIDSTKKWLHEKA
ncbi:NAD(P)-dependent oxidoreductase [Akkermansiaceae bacterium]|nr:NAD(P)-dependent oxidoreductase [Akkermansiaceae bacterium]